jgi:uncharacterized membrane protein (DUF2068 family)
MPPTHMPLGVVVLAALVIATGGLVVLFGIAFLGSFSLPGVVMIVLGAAQVAAGVGLMRLRRWAWWLTMIVAAVGVVFDLATLERGMGNVLRLAAGLVVIAYLLAAARHFQQAPAALHAKI